MVAIEARYLGPTNARGSRIVVSRMDHKQGDRVGRKVYSYDHSLDREAVYDEPVKQFCKDMGWSGVLISGGTARGKVYTFLPDSMASAHRIVEVRS